MLKVSYPEAKWMTNNRWTPNTHCFLHLFTQAGFWQLFPILPVNVILSMFSGQENWRWFLLVLELNLMFGLLAWYSVFLTLLQTWINPTIPSAPITLKALCIISPQPIRNKPVCTHIHTHTHTFCSLKPQWLGDKAGLRSTVLPLKIFLEERKRERARKRKQRRGGREVNKESRVIENCK